MVKETVPDNHKELQMELISGCTDYRDYEEAWKWAKYYKMDYNTLPGTLQVYIENQSDKKISNDNHDEECWDDLEYEGNSASVYGGVSEELFYKFPLDESQSILVDNVVRFEQMINNLKVRCIKNVDTIFK